MNTLDNLWSAVDISDNITRGMKQMRGMSQLNRLLTSVAYLLIAGVLLYWFVYPMDILSTYNSAVVVVERQKQAAPTPLATDLLIPPAQASAPAEAAGIGLALLMLLPTAVELFMVGLARELHFARVVYAGITFFDLLTDYPAVHQLAASSEASFHTDSLLGQVAFKVYEIGWLLLVSFGFEVVSVVLLVVGTVTLLGVVLGKQADYTEGEYRHVGPTSRPARPASAAYPSAD